MCGLDDMRLRSSRRQSTSRVNAAVLALLMLVGTGLAAHAQAPPDATIPRVPDPPPKGNLENLPGDLRAVDVPGPQNLNEFIKNPFLALALGKALFWDMQVGSDGIQACASCHFRAGADPRTKNQVHPDIRSVFPGPNVQLEASDFPLTRLADPEFRRGALDPASDSSDVVSSQGIHHPGNELDTDGFFIGSVNTRRVEPRNGRQQGWTCR
jgi:hypothetical protein